MWFLRLPASLAKKLQCVHLCGFSPIWMRECLFNIKFVLNDLMHCEQSYLLPTLWACSCWRKFLLFENAFGQRLQLFRVSIFDDMDLSHSISVIDWGKTQNTIWITFTFYTLWAIQVPDLLSPSGDLGIGLVWDNPTGPDRTGPNHISVRLLKASSNWTKLSMRSLQLFSGWYQMIFRLGSD